MSDCRVTIRLLQGETAEMREFQRVLEEAPTYTHRITGYPPDAADAQSTYSALPEGKRYEDKFVFGIFSGEEMIGCVDLIRGYPTKNTALIGLLLLSEHYQHRGLGREAYFLIEDFIRSWHKCDRVRIGLVRTNEEVMPFLAKLGFEPTGETKPYRHASVVSEAVILEKQLPNKAPLSTPASVTPVAGSPGAPASVAADL